MKHPGRICYDGGMKSSTRLIALPLLAVAATFLGACQSASYIRTDPLTLAAVPAVLQANPDILGGLVGREAISPNTAPRGLGSNTQLQRAELDQRAYLIWKHSQKS
jgi:hypothetical protein